MILWWCLRRIKKKSLRVRSLKIFDRIMLTYYNEKDREQGFIRVTNRRGKRENFPLMSCSVAACTNEHRPYESFGEIARDAAALKCFLKSQPGSHYLRDRRSAPIENLEKAYEVLQPALPGLEGRKTQNPALVPLGQLLLQGRYLREEQLAEALKVHLRTGKRLGQVLIQMKIMTPGGCRKSASKKS